MIVAMDDARKDRAEQLLNDAVLKRAIKDARAGHLELLYETPPDMFEDLCRIQGTIRALDDIDLVLRRYLEQDGEEF